MSMPENFLENDEFVVFVIWLKDGSIFSTENYKTAQQYLKTNIKKFKKIVYQKTSVFL